MRVLFNQLLNVQMAGKLMYSVCHITHYSTYWVFEKITTK